MFISCNMIKDNKMENRLGGENELGESKFSINWLNKTVKYSDKQILKN